MSGFGRRSSEYIEDGYFGNQRLQMGDFMDDSEIDRRFPKDEEDHFHHHLTRNNNINGMHHYTVERKDQDNKCLICLTEFKAGEKTYKLRCGHIFHEDCLVPWRNSHNTCPVCRQQIDLNGPSDQSGACVIC